MAKKQAPAAVPPTGPDAAPAGKGRLKLIILIVVAMLVAVGLSVGGTLYFMSKGDDLEGSKTQEAATTVSGKQPAIYEVLMPAFVVSELTAAFQIGFLLYLPFVVIDLIVSNILLAMGMMMVSPVTISLPLKLFLFVMVDGWSRLIQGLVLTYA